MPQTQQEAIMADNTPKTLTVEGVTVNQTLFENVRNNVASKVKGAAKLFAADESNAGKTFDPTSVPGLQAYADEYTFGARVARISEPVDPVEREAKRIATETVDEALRNHTDKTTGAPAPVKKKSLAEGVYDKMVATYAAKPDILAEAKRRVTARGKIGADILAEMGAA
jgi:hypothetical protein